MLLIYVLGQKTKNKREGEQYCSLTQWEVSILLITCWLWPLATAIGIMLLYQDLHLVAIMINFDLHTIYNYCYPHLLLDHSESLGLFLSSCKNLVTVCTSTSLLFVWIEEAAAPPPEAFPLRPCLQCVRKREGRAIKDIRNMI